MASKCLTARVAGRDPLNNPRTENFRTGPVTLGLQMWTKHGSEN